MRYSGPSVGLDAPPVEKAVGNPDGGLCDPQPGVDGAGEESTEVHRPVHRPSTNPQALKPPGTATARAKPPKRTSTGERSRCGHVGQGVQAARRLAVCERIVDGGDHTLRGQRLRKEEGVLRLEDPDRLPDHRV